MVPYSHDTAVQILQLAIAPVVLISGVGLVILSQTNRMAHVIDRIRHLIAAPNQTPASRKQIQLLYARARMIRISIISLILCIFFDALVILEIFIWEIFGLKNGSWATSLFFASILSLIVGIFTFLLDVNGNLRAVKIEIDESER
ncbi:MAG: DUF2721 domain-containing protein [Candidatus Omnitrophica bacterium]|nr:DUF2721 domain-containing protein [Candidatus Omnitrophota bacterium]MCA9431690.1 DUF2721 domain-containing protein [Candidatus Omnitrophota bacterium]MCA9442549.1 DUF2721 domain-containing protein [Candidatus Omnitrophota bacterium]MCA9447660.1 DUF2721 domain-containing protein [Candidatus Omnitrophota bacterium]MCB9784259.1 DUF2721 domain-containing protein [Candidatus Omnitrophota bacterium]